MTITSLSKSIYWWFLGTPQAPDYISLTLSSLSLTDRDYLWATCTCTK